MVAAGRLRALTVVNVVFSGMLLIITTVFTFPPPMVFAGAALALFAVSLLRQIGARNT